MVDEFPREVEFSRKSLSQCLYPQSFGGVMSAIVYGDAKFLCQWITPMRAFSCNEGINA